MWVIKVQQQGAAVIKTNRMNQVRALRAALLCASSLEQDSAAAPVNFALGVKEAERFPF